MKQILFRFYDRTVLEHPRTVLIMLVLLLGFAAMGLPKVKLDASADSLVLEGDKALEFYRTTAKRYGTSEFLVISYRPHADLMSPQALDDLRSLDNELSNVEHVDNVVSVLDVPLLYSPPVSFTELSGDLSTLSDSTVNREMARKELSGSPI